jgi:DNA-binding CsgD family transcriptional regulator
MFMGKHDSATCDDEIASLAPRRDDRAMRLASPRVGLAPETDDPVLALGRCDVATCVLDPTLTLRFFTRSAQELLGIGGHDIGKPFARVRLPFADRTLEEDLRAALTADGPVERDIEAEDGRWYKRSAFSYLGDRAESAGVVVSFADATEIKLAALSVDRLTSRERDVIAQVIAGHPNKVIAFNLAISRRTVEYHRQRAMAKLKVGTLAALIRLCVLAGLRLCLLSIWH